MFSIPRAARLKALSRYALRGAIVGCLALAAAGKTMGAESARGSLGWMFLPVLLAEALAVGLLLCGRDRGGALLSGAIGVGGWVVSYASPRKPCACLGAWITLSPAAHAALAAGLAMASSILLVLSRRSIPRR